MLVNFYFNILTQYNIKKTDYIILMIKIKIFEGGLMNKGIFNSECLKNAVLSCFNPNNVDILYKDKLVCITADDDFTHAIIINTATPELKIPKENVIGLAWEPIKFLIITEGFIIYAIKHIGKYYIGDKHNLPDPFIEGYGYLTYNSLPKEISQKNKKMSIVLSHKQRAPGHTYRHSLVKCILQNNIPVDIFGLGCKFYNTKDERVKGVFKDSEPYLNYFFTISIENFRSNHYFSEKIINPLLYDCCPIYLGCHNINTYLNDGSIQMVGNIKDDMELIVKILLNPLDYYKIVDKEYINNKTNLLKNLDTLF